MRKFIIALYLFIVIAFTSNAEIFTDEELEKQRWVESKGNNLAISHRGAVGIAQFLPSTWYWMKSVKLIPQYYDIHMQHHQIDAQEIYLLYLYDLHWRYGINRKRAALASYNYGRGNVLRTIAKYGIVDWEKYLPKETRNYLKQILDS
jgi:hypothetical protein